MDDFELLEKELKVSNQRIKKLQEHKKSTQEEIEKSRPEAEHQTLLETMNRIEKNLDMEFKKKEGITGAMNSSKKS